MTSHKPYTAHVIKEFLARYLTIKFSTKTTVEHKPYTFQLSTNVANFDKNYVALHNLVLAMNSIYHCIEHNHGDKMSGLYTAPL